MIKTVSKPSESSQEDEFRRKYIPDVSKIVEKKNLVCTSCNVSLKNVIASGKEVLSHPFLGTILCKKCENFYGDGEFSVDEDGSDKYCRWCGQGGTLFLCSNCTGGFCKKCIKRNLSSSALEDVEGDDWQCYCCNVKPLYELRALCWAAREYAALNGEKKDTSSPRKGRNEHGSDSDSKTKNSSRSNRSKKRDRDLGRKHPRKRTRTDDEGDSDSGGKGRTKRSKRHVKSESSDSDTLKKSERHSASSKSNKRKSGKDSDDEMDQKHLKAYIVKINQVLDDSKKLSAVLDEKCKKLRKMPRGVQRTVEVVDARADQIESMLNGFIEVSTKMVSSFVDFRTNWKSYVEKAKGTTEPEKDSASPLEGGEDKPDEESASLDIKRSENGTTEDGKVADDASPKDDVAESPKEKADMDITPEIGKVVDPPENSENKEESHEELKKGDKDSIISIVDSPTTKPKESNVEEKME